MDHKLSSHAIAAKEIRNRLKAAGIVAKVRSSSFSMGDDVNVNLIDADPATVKLAEEIAKPFQYGHFDGMIDCYEYSNKRSDLPAQVKFVFVNNEASEQTSQHVYDFVRATFAEARDWPALYKNAYNIRTESGDYVPQFVWRQFCQADSLYWQNQERGA